MYKIKCGNCDGLYIGQASKKLKYSCLQHEKDVNRQKQRMVDFVGRTGKTDNEDAIKMVTQQQTALVKNAITHNHVFKFQEAEIIDNHKHTKKREFLESV